MTWTVFFGRWSMPTQATIRTLSTFAFTAALGTFGLHCRDRGFD
jgi:hypothetical protein